MLRPTLLRLPTRLTTARPLSTTARLLAEGSTGSGSSRAGGSAQGDAFTKREQASEDFYVRQHEMEKLKAIRDKLRAQSADTKDLDEHIEGIEKAQK